MKRAWLVLAGLALSTAVVARPAAAPKAPKMVKGKKKQLLFFTKAAGNEHAVIKVVDGQPSLAEKILKELGEKNGFEVTHTKDGGVFTPEGIAKYDGFVFYTTGDLTTPGVDKNPPMPAGGKELLLDAIHGGKAFIGIHVASDTFLSSPDHFADLGDKADPYIKMVGGEFIWHGQQQKARVFCSDPKFPGFADVKDGFELLEEWYSFKHLSKDDHVILWLGTWSLMNTGKDSVYRRAPYPVAWARMHGKGRVFYTALGHRDDVWTNPMFQTMLTGGIEWATGEAKADVKPNIATVTPYYNEMPPNDAKTPPAPTAAAKPAPAPAH